MGIAELKFLKYGLINLVILTFLSFYGIIYNI